MYELKGDFETNTNTLAEDLKRLPDRLSRGGTLETCALKIVHLGNNRTDHPAALRLNGYGFVEEGAL